VFKKITIGIAVAVISGVLLWLFTTTVETSARSKVNTNEINGLRADVKDIHRIHYEKYRGR